MIGNYQNDTVCQYEYVLVQVPFYYKFKRVILAIIDNV